MREIVFDTETTGFDPDTGDRVVEIGAVELVNHLPSGRQYHQYINPERSMPADAFAVHGLGDEFLADKPKFAEIADAFLEFFGTDARLIAHNANFDMKFLNAELKRAGRPTLAMPRMLDSLMLAREKWPGSPNSLDALCRRYSVDNSGRELHGALLDSQLLAEVYLELIGGRQPEMTLEVATAATLSGTALRDGPRLERARPLQPRITEAEIAAHREFVAKMGDAAIWQRYALD